MKTLIVVKCPHCGDTYVATDNIIGWHINTLINEKTGKFENETEVDEMKFRTWLDNPTGCWKCGNFYRPLGNVRLIDDFVYEASKRVKGE